MKIKNVNPKIAKKVAKCALVPVLAAITLTGCGNYDM